MFVLKREKIMALVTHHDHAGRAHPRTREEVDFASDRAGELAVELGIPKDILAAAEGSGTDGALTVKDIRRIVA